VCIAPALVRGTVEEVHRFGNVPIDAAAEFLHQAEDEHSFDIALGDRFVEPDHGRWCNFLARPRPHNTLSEERFRVRIAFGRSLLSVPDGVSIMTRLPGCGGGKTIGIRSGNPCKVVVRSGFHLLAQLRGPIRNPDRLHGNPRAGVA